jgi:uncharacterized protein YegP (UPF0339 family)
MAGKFEVYKDKAGEFRWKLIASNDKEIASGQGYKSKESCMDGINSVRTNAPTSEVVDKTK